MRAISLYLIDLFAGSLGIAFGIFFALKPIGELQLWFLLIVLCIGVRFFVNLTLLCFKSPKKSYGCRAGLNVISILLIFLGARWGVYERDALFIERINDYNEAVNYIKASDLTGRFPLNPISIPPKYDSLAVAVLADRSDSGIVTVQFFIGGGFPLKHVGYMYRSNNDFSSYDAFSGKRFNMRRILQNWYAFSD